MIASRLIPRGIYISRRKNPEHEQRKRDGLSVTGHVEPKNRQESSREGLIRSNKRIRLNPSVNVNATYAMPSHQAHLGAFPFDDILAE